MNSIRFSPVVYSRTFRADYHMIVLPEYLESNISKLQALILGTTRSPEMISNCNRYLIFRNQTFLIFGVSTLAQNLSEDQLMTVDEHKRPIYGFFGFAAKIAIDQPISIPDYSLLSAELAKPLYRYVLDRWSIQQYEAQPQTVSDKNDTENIFRVPSFSIQAPSPDEDTPRSANESFNVDIQKIYLWPSTVNEKIWEGVQRRINSPDKTSLCLNMFSQNDALSSDFLNSTVVQDIQHQKLSKPTQIDQKSINSQVGRNTSVDSSMSQQLKSPQIARSPQRIQSNNSNTLDNLITTLMNYVGQILSVDHYSGGNRKSEVQDDASALYYLLHRLENKLGYDKLKALIDQYFNGSSSSICTTKQDTGSNINLSGIAKPKSKPNTTTDSDDQPWF